jgi:hypothetical protein
MLSIDKTKRALVLSAIFTLVGREATAAVFKDQLVQAPKLAAPELGSVAGTLSGLAFEPGSLSRGDYALPALPDVNHTHPSTTTTSPQPAACLTWCLG